ncbi:MAG: hypothetical protein ACE5H7_05000 [Acidiferrobacterales bacterium]
MNRLAGCRLPWQASLISGLFFAVAVAAESPATELIMFRSQTCEWCDMWEADVGSVYAKTPESRSMPLRRVDIEDPLPPDLTAIEPVAYTPTFVLWENGRELGRIVGYSGESHFWGLLEMLMHRSEPPSAAFVASSRGTAWAR